MRLNERYITLYAVVVFLSGLVLIAIGVRQIEVYYAVYLIEFLVTVELVASFRRSLEKHLRPVIIVFLFGFVYTVVQRVLEILR